MDRTAKTIIYLAGMHIFALVVMSVCRLILLFANMPLENIEWDLAGRAMLIGVKFDNLIGCYIIAPPSIVLPIIALIYNVNVNKLAVKITTWWFGVLYSLTIFIEIANARYFHFFENHLNIGVTEWFGFVGDTAGLIFGDAVNRVFIGIAFALIALYIFAIRIIHHTYSNTIK